MPRPAKSEQQQWLHGHKSKARPKPELGFVPGRPKRPAHLSEAAKLEFKRVSKLLSQRRTETEGDFAILAVYASVYDRWVMASRSVQESGLMIQTTVTDNHGESHVVERLNPLLKVIEHCEGRMLSLLKSMGLTPVDREKAKPLQTEPTTGVVPGSVAETYPELLVMVAKKEKANVVS